MDTAGILQRAMIADWRDAERLRIDVEMHALAARLTQRFGSEADGLSWRDLVSPKATKLRKIRRNVEAELNRAYVRELRNIDESLESSTRIVSGTERSAGITILDATGLVAGGTLAVSSLVAAASAATLATTTTTTLVLLATTAFSWPVFLTVGAGAVAAALASPRIMAQTTDRLRNRVRSGIAEQIELHLIGRPGGSAKDAVRTALLETVEGIFRQRLEKVST